MAVISGTVSARDTGGLTASRSFSFTTTTQTGAGQYPNLLDIYPTKPTWQVAGVHFRVGVPVGTSLKNPGGISISGVGLNSGSRSVTVSGNNVVLDGYDFGLSNGWQIWVDGSNCTIRNSNFVLGSNSGIWQIGGQGANLTIESCTMDASTRGNQSGLINYRGTSLTVRNNWWKNFPQHAVEMTQAPGTAVTLVYTNNLIENGGLSAPQGAHLNFLQWGHIANGSKATVNNNTVYQHIYEGGEAFQFYPNNGAAGKSVAEFGFNTIVAPKGPNNQGITTAISNVIHSGSNGQFGTSYHDNYADYTGCNGFFYANEPGNTYSNNRNMVTGAVITPTAQ